MAAKSTGTAEKAGSTKENPFDMILLSLASLYEQVGQIDGALGIYNSLLKHNPKCVTALSNRAIIWLLKSQDDKAVTDSHKAASIAPRDRNALRSRAIVQMIAGSMDSALKDFRKALEASEWDSLTCLFAFIALNKSGNQAEAGEMLNNAIDDKIKGQEWPFQVLQYWRNDILMTDLIAMANAGRSRLIDCRAYLGFARALSANGIEGKPDLQFVYNSRSGSPLVRAIAARGLKLLQEDNADNIAVKKEKADRNVSMDWMG